MSTEPLALFGTAPDLRTDGGRTRCPACGTLTAAADLAPATTYDGARVCRRCADLGAEAVTLPLDEPAEPQARACPDCGRDQYPATAETFGPTGSHRTERTWRHEHSQRIGCDRPGPDLEPADPDDQDPNDALFPHVGPCPHGHAGPLTRALAPEPEPEPEPGTLFGPTCDRCGATDPGPVPEHLYPGSWSTSLAADCRTTTRHCWTCRKADDDAARARREAEPLPPCGHRACAGLEDCWQRPDDDEPDELPDDDPEPPPATPRADLSRCASCGRDLFNSRPSKRHPGGGASCADGVMRCHDCVTAEDHPDLGPDLGAGRCRYGIRADLGDNPGRFCPEPATHAAVGYQPADEYHDERTARIECCRTHADYYATAWLPLYPDSDDSSAWIDILPGPHVGPLDRAELDALTAHAATGGALF